MNLYNSFTLIDIYMKFFFKSLSSNNYFSVWNGQIYFVVLSIQGFERIYIYVEQATPKILYKQHQTIAPQYSLKHI